MNAIGVMDPANPRASEQQVVNYLCGLELHRRRLILGRLELLLEEVRLTPPQARDVMQEVRVQKAAVRELQRLANIARVKASYYRRRVAAGKTIRSARRAAPACGAATEPART